MYIKIHCYYRVHLIFETWYMYIKSLKYLEFFSRWLIFIGLLINSSQSSNTSCQITWRFIGNYFSTLTRATVNIRVSLACNIFKTPRLSPVLCRIVSALFNYITFGTSKVNNSSSFVAIIISFIHLSFSSILPLTSNTHALHSFFLSLLLSLHVPVNRNLASCGVFSSLIVINTEFSSLPSSWFSQFF